VAAAAPIDLESQLAAARAEEKDALAACVELSQRIVAGDPGVDQDEHRRAVHRRSAATAEILRLEELCAAQQRARQITARAQAAADRAAAELAADRAYLAALQEQQAVATKLAEAFGLIPPMLEALTANTDRLRDFMRTSPAASRGGAALGAAAPNTHDINGCVSRLVAVSKSGAEPFEDIQRASAAAIADAQLAIARRTDNDLPPTAA
jgi:hypothetical protein